MNLEKLTKNQIAKKLNERFLTVQIIQNHEDKTQASLILGDKFFTCAYEIDYDDETLWLICNHDVIINEETPIFVFTDKELQQAWINSYLQGGISEDRFDRRADFHPYNELNELFCIDLFLLEDITGERRGGDETLQNWKKGVINWYRNQLI